VSHLLSIQAAGVTDTGRVRSRNEDAVWVDPEGNLLIVADGLGGHASGDKASGLAISIIPECFNRYCRDAGASTPSDRFSAVAHALRLALGEANRAIFEAAQSDPRDHGMGCTCTAVFFHDGLMSFAHVGDSRCYLIRNGGMTQITEDHSLVAEQLKQGLISPAEAATGNQNILARAMGVEPYVEIDIGEEPVSPGDIALLCSDGLNKELSDAEILEIVETAREPQEIAERLVQAANAVRGRDNITVAVARVDRVTDG
jgi:protein phosphatase